MNEFVELINPEHLDYFTPDMILAFFGLVLVLDLIGVVFEIFFSRRK